MSGPPADMARGHRFIEPLLRRGTWLACALIALGAILHALPPAARIPLLGSIGVFAAWAGVAILILLPIARVGVMLAVFAVERDRIYAAIAASVLLIIATSVVVSL